LLIVILLILQILRLKKILLVWSLNLWKLGLKAETNINYQKDHLNHPKLDDFD